MAKKVNKEVLANSNLPKFTLKGVQFRKHKLELTADVVVGDEVVEGYPVGWVTLRGQQDPLFLRKYSPHLREYQDLVIEAQGVVKESKEDAETLKDQSTLLEEALQKLLVYTVSCAIEDWDKDFFGADFSQESAVECFSDEENNHIYNQIAMVVREKEHFLPVVSILPVNG